MSLFQFPGTAPMHDAFSRIKHPKWNHHPYPFLFLFLGSDIRGTMTNAVSFGQVTMAHFPAGLSKDGRREEEERRVFPNREKRREEIQSEEKTRDKNIQWKFRARWFRPFVFSNGEGKNPFLFSRVQSRDTFDGSWTHPLRQVLHLLSRRTLRKREKRRWKGDTGGKYVFIWYVGRIKGVGWMERVAWCERTTNGFRFFLSSFRLRSVKNTSERFLSFVSNFTKRR